VVNAFSYKDFAERVSCLTAVTTSSPLAMANQNSNPGAANDHSPGVADASDSR